LQGRQIQRIIGGVAGHHVGRQRCTQRIQGRQHHFELRQVRPIVFRAAAPEQPGHLRLGIEADGSAVQPHPAGGQPIHTNHLLIDLGFQGVPDLVLAQEAGQFAQPIIGQVGRPEWLPDQLRQGLGPLVRPVLDMTHKVIMFGQDMNEPQFQRLPGTQACPIAMLGDNRVEGRTNSELRMEQKEQHRYVIDPFGRHLERMVHAHQLCTKFRFCPNF
jgi:hypothetical protein